jgi:hypothetical protein
VIPASIKPTAKIRVDIQGLLEKPRPIYQPRLPEILRQKLAMREQNKNYLAFTLSAVAIIKVPYVKFRTGPGKPVKRAKNRPFLL